MRKFNICPTCANRICETENCVAECAEDEDMSAEGYCPSYVKPHEAVVGLKELFFALLLTLCLSLGIVEADPPDWNKAVIHHSATEQGNVAAIRRYHIEEKGWELYLLQI